MIEVFRTTVQHTDHATIIVNTIHEQMNHYRVNFDLHDCDKVMRVTSPTVTIESQMIVDLLRSFGYDAEVLTDTVPSNKN